MFQHDANKPLTCTNHIFDIKSKLLLRRDINCHFWWIMSSVLERILGCNVMCWVVVCTSLVPYVATCPISVDISVRGCTQEVCRRVWLSRHVCICLCCWVAIVCSWLFVAASSLVSCVAYGSVSKSFAPLGGHSLSRDCTSIEYWWQASTD